MTCNIAEVSPISVEPQNGMESSYACNICAPIRKFLKLSPAKHGLDFLLACMHCLCNCAIPRHYPRIYTARFEATPVAAKATAKTSGDDRECIAIRDDNSS